MKQRATRLCAAGTLALALTTATTVLGASAEVRADHGFRKVGYFTQWGIYTRHFVVKNLQDNGNAGRLTHINYAFGKVARNAAGDVVCSSGDPWADYQKPFTAREDVNGVGEAWGAPLRGNFNQLKKLKARNPDVKVLISLGGWRWSRYFSDAALTRESRRTFVKSCISLFLKGNLPKLDGGSGGPGTGAGVFDGIDLDWEWPGSPGRAGNIVRRVDGANFTKLVAEFRRQLDRYGGRTGKRYALTAFLPAAPARIRAGVEVARLFRLLDFATIQGYDFHGTWERRTNHQAQLFSPPRDPDRARFSLDRAIDIYRARGAPARKLVVGVPYFGRGWTGVPRANDGLYQRSAGAARGTFEAGIEDYRVLNRRRGVHYRDPAHGAHWLYDGTRWWSYDDRIEVARKMRYVIANRLGGAMMWSLDGDDARGRLTATIDRVLTAG
jgi:chitinase